MAFKSPNQIWNDIFKRNSKASPLVIFFRLLRYKNLCMVLLTLVLTNFFLLDAIIPNNHFSLFHFIIFSLSVVFISAFGYVINDYFDVEADLINKPNKVYVTKIISKQNTKIVAFSLAIIGLFLGGFVIYFENKFELFSVYLFVVIGLYLYSYSLKKIALLGNLLIAILCALPIFLLYLLTIDVNFNPLQTAIFLDYPVLAYITFASFITFIREIIKDIEDINGDAKINAKTLPILLGRKRAKNAAFFFSCILFLVSIFSLLLLQEVTSVFVYFFVFIFLPLLYFMYQLWFAKSKKDFTLLSNLLKLILFFGILSMLFFKWIY